MVSVLASWKTTWVFLVCLGTFVLLRSRDFTAVDGAVRCLEVFHRQELFFHANNHLLYPVAIFGWHGLLGLLGYHATTPVAYMAASQLLNALAAAGCCAIVFRLGTLMTGSWRIALLGAATLAISRSFLLHATNSTEPMLGLLWSLLALLVVALSISRPGLGATLVAGALMALAMATYQSMVFFGPGVLALAFLGSRRGLTAVARVASFAVGMLAAAVIIYGSSYAAQGIPGLAPKLARFTVVENGNGAFGGLSLRNLLLLPLGLTTNLAPVLPEGFSGIRSLVATGAPAMLFAGVSVLLVTLGVGVICWCAWRARAQGGPGHDHLALALFVALVSTTVPPLVWDPLYDKLWLQPLTCVALLLPLAFSSGSSTRWRGVKWAAAAVIATFAAANLRSAVEAHRAPAPYLAEAGRVAALTRPGDLVVHEWDSISVLFGTIWGWERGRYRFDFPTHATDLGPGARKALDQAVAATLRRQGRVYFLGVVDQPPEEWRVFLGGRTRVPFDSLAPYRERLRSAETFVYRGRPLHLYEWSPGIGPRTAIEEAR